MTTVNTQAGKLFNRINDLFGNSGIHFPSTNETLRANASKNVLHIFLILCYKGLRESVRKHQKATQPSSPAASSEETQVNTRRVLV